MITSFVLHVRMHMYVCMHACIVYVYVRSHIAKIYWVLTEHRSLSPGTLHRVDKSSRYVSPLKVNKILYVI